MKLNEFFEQNQSKFDVYEPKPGHKERFLSKLNKLEKAKKRRKIKRFYQFAGVAASLIILFGIFSFLGFEQQSNNPAKQEVKQNEQYFSQIIKAELEQIKAEETPETKKVFEDAMKQITALENAYKKLVDDYQVNHDKYLLDAMINNFEKRIEILQFVKKQIKIIKQSKTYKYEENRA